jgi:tRNA 2-selenouridine synthase
MKNYEIKDFMKASTGNVIVDVRSPLEFAKGHIPGAVNIPLLSDEERGIVGTKYKRESKDTALTAAIGFIAESADNYLDVLSKFDENKKICVYCWRGGFRSEGAWKLFQAVGKNVVRLHGGYKAYRNYVLQTFEKDYRLIIIGGMTGSGKSDLLMEIGKRGEQLIDLEGLANHKGSAFGSLGQAAQPSIQQFENNLFSELDKLDPNRRIWMEDESRLIGKVKIPDAFFAQMRSTNVIKVMPGKENRIKRLVKDYAEFSQTKLITSIERISQRLGGDNTAKAITAITQNDFYTATDLILNYYDKTYNYGLNKRNSELIHPLEIDGKNLVDDVDEILRFADSRRFF